MATQTFMTTPVQAFSLVDLSPSKDPTEEKVELTVSIDESGIISAEALDLTTGKKVRHQLDRKATQQGDK